MVELTDVEAAWLAGVLEGDGSFTFAYKTCPRLQFACCDLDVVQRVADLIGGKVSISKTPKGDKPFYFTSKATKKDLHSLLIRIYPYMGDRRKKRISELLNYLFINSKEGIPSQMSNTVL